MPTETSPRGASTMPASYHAAHAMVGATFSRPLVFVGLAFPIIVPNLVFITDMMFLSPFFLTLWAPSLIAILVFAIWNRPWSYITAGILGTLYPLATTMMMGIGDGQIIDPRQLGFIAMWSILAGTVMLWAGVVQGFRGLRGTSRTVPFAEGLGTRAGQVSILAFAIFVGMAATGAMAANQVSEVPGGFDFAPGATMTVVIEDFEFPTDMTVQSGVITEIIVENRDTTLHTFTYVNDGIEYSHDILGGQTISFLVLFENAGEVAVRCIPHSDGYTDGMVTTLTVT